MNSFNLESETHYTDFDDINEFLVPINNVPNYEIYEIVKNSVTNEFKCDSSDEQKVVLTNKLQIYNTIQFIENFATRFYMLNNFTLILHNLKQIYNENKLLKIFNFITLNKKYVCEINKEIGLMILHFREIGLYDKAFDGYNALITNLYNITSI